MADQAKIGTPVKRELRTIQQFSGYLAERAEHDSDGLAAELADQQLAKIMAAQTAEEMFAADELEMPAGKDLVGVEQTVNSLTVHPSSDRFSAPLGHYIVVRSQRMENGEELIWNTGSPLVIGKLRWLEAKNLLPCDVVLEGIATPNGERLRLKPVPKRATKATAAS